MPTVDWKFLFGVGLVGITVAGIWLMMNASRDKRRMVVWSQFRVHLGTALLVSAITIVLIDLQLQREVEAHINEIPNVMLNTVCKGDRGVESAVQQMLADPVRYSNIVIDAQLSPDPSPDPRYSRWVWTTSFDVHNVSDY